MVSCETFLSGGLGMGGRVAGPDVTDDVREGAGPKHDDIWTQVIVNLVAVDLHFGPSASSEADKVGAAHQGIMPEASAVFGGRVAGDSVVTPMVNVGFVARWAAAGLLFLMVG
jgi:hypothetical protein